jgi:hypothetical protein
MVYAESTSGGAIRCWSGENAAIAQGGGVSLTYPGTNEITAPGACKAVMGPKGSITIDVPKEAVSLEAGTAPLDKFLYSITASTMTLPQQANAVQPVAGLGGSLFNLIDVVQAYNSQS